MLTITLQSRTGGKNRTRQDKGWNLVTAQQHPPVEPTEAATPPRLASLTAKHIP